SGSGAPEQPLEEAADRGDHGDSPNDERLGEAEQELEEPGLGQETAGDQAADPVFGRLVESGLELGVGVAGVERDHRQDLVDAAVDRGELVHAANDVEVENAAAPDPAALV